MSIFIDASIFIRLLLDEAGADLAQKILEQVEANKVIAYTTPAVLEEVTFKLIFARASDILNTKNIWKIREEFRLNEKFRFKCLEPVEKLYDYIKHLTRKGLRIVSIVYDDWIESLKISKKYGLLPADSIHLAIASRVTTNTIATFDSDFKRVKRFGVIP